MTRTAAWARKPLRGKIHVKHGFPFKSEFFAASGQQVVVTPGNFHEGGGFKWQEGKEKFYTSSYPAAYLLGKGDLIVAMTEQAEGLLGSTALVPQDARYLHNQRIGLVTSTSDEVVTDFLFHLFKTASVREQISNSASGSKVRHTSPERIYDVEALLPPASEQKKIAALLSALDAKIDLNNRINAELEALAKTIYDYWFVQFDFPDDHGRPYKTSGGPMAYNPTLKREIPAGWQASTLANIVNVSTASVNPASQPERAFRHLSIPSLDESRSFIEECGSEIGSNKFVVSPCDLLVSKLNPWFNRVTADTLHENLICSTEFVVWRCNEPCFQAFLETLARHPQFITYCTQSVGSTSGSHSRVNPQVMMAFPLPYSAKYADEFGKVAASMLQKRILATRENRELTQLRDWLLPLLMNGQVRVGS